MSKFHGVTFAFLCFCLFVSFCFLFLFVCFFIGTYFSYQTVYMKYCRYHYVRLRVYQIKYIAIYINQPSLGSRLKGLIIVKKFVCFFFPFFYFLLFFLPPLLCPTIGFSLCFELKVPQSSTL